MKEMAMTHITITTVTGIHHFFVSTLDEAFEELINSDDSKKQIILNVITEHGSEHNHPIWDAMCADVCRIFEEENGPLTVFDEVYFDQTYKQNPEAYIDFLNVNRDMIMSFLKQGDLGEFEIAYPHD